MYCNLSFSRRRGQHVTKLIPRPVRREFTKSIMILRILGSHTVIGLKYVFLHICVHLVNVVPHFGSIDIKSLIDREGQQKILQNCKNFIRRALKINILSVFNWVKTNITMHRAPKQFIYNYISIYPVSITCPIESGGRRAGSW